MLDSRVRGHDAAREGDRRERRAASAAERARRSGYYGNARQPVDERSRPATTSSPASVAAWEAATAPAEQAGVRVAHMRTGSCSAATAEPSKKMLPLFKLGARRTLRDGRQWMSWISIDDEVAAIEHLLDLRRARGRSTSPRRNPCRNAEFAQDARRPCSGGRLSSRSRSSRRKLLLGSELADALVFGGQHVAPTVLLADGYPIRAPELEPSPAGRARSLITRPITRRGRGQCLTIWTSSSICDLVADHHTTGLERGVPLDAAVLAVDVVGAEKPARVPPHGSPVKPSNSTSNVTGLVTPLIVRSALSMYSSPSAA